MRNDDIVADVAARNPRPFTVGFAAETQQVLEHARAKLARKRLDLIVANDVSRADIGFDSDCNEVSVISARGEHAIARGSKASVARALVAEIARSYRTCRGGGDS